MSLTPTVVAPISTRQINNVIYVGEGYTSHTIQDGVDYAALRGLPCRVVILSDYQGTDTIAAVVRGTTSITIVDERTAAPEYYDWSGTAYVPADTYIGGNLTVQGEVDASTVTATGATFATCDVDNSPVRTFANTASGGGPSYPPAGIGVSTGTAWNANSIDPAQIPLLDEANTFTQALTLDSTLIMGTPGELTILASESGVGGATASLRVDSKLDLILNPGVVAGTAGDVYLNWEQGVGSYTVFGNGNGTKVGYVDTNGNLQLNGNLALYGATGVNGFVIASSSAALSAATPALRVSPNQDIILNPGVVGGTSGVIYLNWEQGGTGVGVIFGDGKGGTLAEVDNTGTLTLAGTATIKGSVLNLGTRGFQIYDDGGNCFINGAGAAGGLLINQAAGASGQTTIYGTLTLTGTKQFRIPHPTDKGKDLVHACIEGPEAAVFYRGEGQTNRAGSATVKLPKYFEALTHESGRTVQLTACFDEDDDDDNGLFGQLAASRVIDGKFSVRSTRPSQRFYWEVKAVRDDVKPLEVEVKASKDGDTHERMRQASRPAKR
jgi:hypothetical protein